MTASRLRILMTFTPDRGDISVNPYTHLLERSLQPLCEVHRFSWPRALAGRYDVLHCHWPEHLVGNKKLLRRSVAQVLFASLLVVLRIRRIAVVETMHNVEPHTSPSRASAWLLRRLERLVDVRIYLHETADVDPRSRSEVFPHGDYREWYADFEPQNARPGRLAYFGRIHRYKNVDGLLRAFAEVPDERRQLVIAGSVQDPELETQIRQIAAADERVELRLTALPDDELGALITSAEAIVVPYEYLYNSGAMLLALTLGRPVVAPRCELADGLAAEVGKEWVAEYDQPLQPAGLVGALEALEADAAQRSASPTFVDRDWGRQAVRLEQLYRETVAGRRG